MAKSQKTEVTFTMDLFSEHGKVNRFKESGAPMTSAYIDKKVLKDLGVTDTVEITIRKPKES